MSNLNLAQKIKNFSWHDYAVLALVVFLIIFGLVIFSKFKHLPGPLYGGDLYSHYGYAQNYVLHGFWNDPYYPGELPTYPWFGHLCIIIFKFITGLSLMKAFIFFPIVSMSAAVVVHYLLGIQFFKNKTLGLCLGVLALLSFGIVDGHPNLLPWMVEIPLFLLFWLRFEETNLTKDKILMGVLLGVVGLTHVAKFIGVLGVFCTYLLFEAVRTRRLLYITKRYVLVLLLAGIVASPFYVPNMIKYKGIVENPVFQYNLPELSELGIGWMMTSVWNSFFNEFRNIGFILAGILGILGMIFIILNWKKQKNYIVLIWFGAGVLLPLHHLITAPLFERWILPHHLSTFSLSILLFEVTGIGIIFSILAKHTKKLAKYAKIALMLLLIVPVAGVRFNDYNADRWVNYGRRMDPLTEAWLEFGEWAKDNTKPNDVFLAFDESAFALNAVSARKLMIVRRTHANFFVDIDRRIADAAIIFYGNNDSLRLELLKKYRVNYFLLDPYFYEGNLKTRPEFAEYLAQNGVQFDIKTDRLDPSIVNAMQFELAIIPPQNISQEFLNRLIKIKDFKKDGTVYLSVFRINKSNDIKTDKNDYR